MATSHKIIPDCRRQVIRSCNRGICSSESERKTCSRRESGQISGSETKNGQVIGIPIVFGISLSSSFY